MTKVFKDGVIMAARDNHQLAAFLNNGWVKAESAIPQNVNMAVKEEVLPFSDKDIQLEESSAEKKYSRSDIQRMNKAELLEMAKNTGVEGADDMTRAELAEYMLSAFGL